MSWVGEGTTGVKDDYSLPETAVYKTEETPASDIHFIGLLFGVRRGILRHLGSQLFLSRRAIDDFKNLLF